MKVANLTAKFALWTGLLGLVCLVLPGSLRADGYGLQFYDNGGASGFGNVSYPGVDIAASSELSYSDSFSLSSPGGETSTFSGSIANGAVGLSSQITIPAGPSGSAGAGADLYFYDTFTFTGTPGQAGQYLVTLTLGGSQTVNVPTGDTTVDLVNNLVLLENGTGTPTSGYSGSVAEVTPGESESIEITADAGTSVELGELLQLREGIEPNGCCYSPPYPAASITIDESDPGYFTVTPLTAGFGYTTASGLSYLTPPGSPTPAPEPSTLLLLGTGLLGLLALVSRSKRRVPSA